MLNKEHSKTQNHAAFDKDKKLKKNLKFKICFFVFKHINAF